MPYNIYLPKDYDADKAKTYPMVVFIADASANINDPKAVLYQATGPSSGRRRKNRPSIRPLSWHRSIRKISSALSA